MTLSVGRGPANFANNQIVMIPEIKATPQSCIEKCNFHTPKTKSGTGVGNLAHNKKEYDFQY